MIFWSWESSRYAAGYIDWLLIVSRTRVLMAARKLCPPSRLFWYRYLTQKDPQNLKIAWLIKTCAFLVVGQICGDGMESCTLAARKMRRSRLILRAARAEPLESTRTPFCERNQDDQSWESGPSPKNPWQTWNVHMKPQTANCKVSVPTAVNLRHFC